MSVKDRQGRERQARREAIAASAFAVFARHGLEGATIEMIAREAEVAVGTIYLYFASRDDLYLQLVAERIERLRASYAEIQARALDPLSELRAVAAAYLDYLRESRELFISQHSVVYAQLRKRLKRASELRHFNEVIEKSHAVWKLYERTVRRVFDAGLIVNSTDPKKTAAVMWSSLNGAFMLMGDGNFFRDLTGLDPEHFVEETLDSYIKTPASSDQTRAALNGASTHRHKSAVRTARAKINKDRDAAQLVASAPA
ncbi:MAG TPA: TetR/AcrR family transcriptional regulator [Candidatus Binataceae bacterium]|nr:TetR/AcrR family transcriptional regulator [Candidatus Binataceae bacterium]